MRAKWSRPYAEAKYSSTSGCHRSPGLNVYRSVAAVAPAAGAAAAAAAGEAEEEESITARAVGSRHLGFLGKGFGFGLSFLKKKTRIFNSAKADSTIEIIYN